MSNIFFFSCITEGEPESGKAEEKRINYELLNYSQPSSNREGKPEASNGMNIDAIRMDKGSDSAT